MRRKQTNSKLTSSLYVLDPWGRNPQPSELMLVESAPNHLNLSSRSRQHAQHGQTGNGEYLFVCVCARIYILYVIVASRIDFNLGGFQIWLLLSTMSPKWQYRQLTTQRTFLPSDMRMLGCYM